VTAGRLEIDGSYGEGGGQIVRTALTLSALTGRPVRLERIRAGRPNPGLGAQHLVAARGLAAVCGARLDGDRPGSSSLDFAPGGPARSGRYAVDVAAGRRGGSAGSAALILQALLLPLALAPGRSELSVRGGTHVPWSPTADYLREVWLPALAALGVRAAVDQVAWGWYPRGGGEIAARIDGTTGPLSTVSLLEPGPLRLVRGRAVVANLPVSIARRMAERAGGLLDEAGLAWDVVAERVCAPSPGAGLFLVAEHDRIRAGATALGRPGLPAEAVAERAVEALLAHERSGGAVDPHLADQLLLPLALGDGPSCFSTGAVSSHLRTNAWVLERFGVADVAIETAAGLPPRVGVAPRRGPLRAP
jgi:RNA 3'-terminal phosphate cyclase (ATP)